MRSREMEYVAAMLAHLADGRKVEGHKLSEVAGCTYEHGYKLVAELRKAGVIKNKLREGYYITEEWQDCTYLDLFVLMHPALADRVPTQAESIMLQALRERKVA